MNRHILETEFSPVLELDYTNHDGKRAIRRVQAHYAWYGTSDHHPGQDPQWFWHVWDLEREAWRDYAAKDIHSWKHAQEAREQKSG